MLLNVLLKLVATGLVLGLNLTHIDSMYNQATNLNQWKTETLMKLVSIIKLMLFYIYTNVNT